MHIEPRAAGATIILDRVELDASGNNDHQRTTLATWTIVEAEAHIAKVQHAIEDAKAALRREQAEELAKAEGELAATEARAKSLRATIARLRGGSVAVPRPAPPDDASLGTAVLTAVMPMAGAIPFADAAATPQLGDEPEMPDFLRRTA